MKRIISITVMIAMVLGLCACGQEAPTWQEQYDLGVRYLSEGNYEEAVIAFTAAIEIDPKLAPAYVGRGDAYVKSGETEDNLAAAKADYEKAIELDEANAEAYLGLANVYIKRDDYDKAIEILRDYIERVGENQVITDKLAEVENLVSSNENTPEENESSGNDSNDNTFESVNETLDLRNVSIEYTTDPEAFDGSNGAVGAMVLDATVNGPSNARDALIGSWYLDEPPTQDEINDMISLMVPIWKEEVKTNPLSMDQQVPFQFGQGHPVTPDELGHTAYVLVIGLDENVDAVGYAIVQENIPG